MNQKYFCISVLASKTPNGWSQRYLISLPFSSRWFWWLILKQVVLKIVKKMSMAGRRDFSKLMPTDLQLAYLWNFNCVRNKEGNYLSDLGNLHAVNLLPRSHIIKCEGGAWLILFPLPGLCYVICYHGEKKYHRRPGE